MQVNRLAYSIYISSVEFGHNSLVGIGSCKQMVSTDRSCGKTAAAVGGEENRQS